MRYQLLLFLILFSGCSLFEKSTKNPDLPLVGTRWVLYTMNGNAVPNLPRSIYLEFTEEKRKRFVGFAGCNDLFGEYSLNPNKVLFEKVGMTRKTCYYQEIETEFMKMLENSTHFKIRGHQLSFYNDSQIIATLKAI